MRLAPWVGYQRDKQRRDKNPMSNAYLNCDDCMGKGRNPEFVRAAWRCGYMLESEWTGDGFFKPDAWPVKTDECPGRLILLPQVEEAARARRFFDKSMLSARYGGEDKLTDVLLDAIEIFQAECDAVEQHMLSEH